MGCKILLTRGLSKNRPQPAWNVHKQLCFGEQVSAAQCCRLPPERVHRLSADIQKVLQYIRVEPEAPSIHSRTRATAVGSPTC